MEIYFNKTEKVNGVWRATVAPASIRKGFIPVVSSEIRAEGFLGKIVNLLPNNTIELLCHFGFPCVGIPHEVNKHWMCYEIHTVQARIDGCDTQCKECEQEQMSK